MNNPPTVIMWLQAPWLAAFIVETFWPYIQIPLEFILGTFIIRNTLDSIRGVSKKSKS